MKQLKGQWSRRSFIAAISGTGAMIILKPLGSFAGDKEDPGVAPLLHNNRYRYT